jgi:hypothetical protein
MDLAYNVFAAVFLFGLGNIETAQYIINHGGGKQLISSILLYFMSAVFAVYAYKSML